MLTSTITTPAGPFTLVVEGDAVLASGWTADADELVALIHPTLRRGADLVARRDLGEITAAVGAYHAGDLRAVDGIPVRQRSGPFLERAWGVLREVEPGAVVSYAELAARAGRPEAVRAAANACARNTSALFVPCHRVVRTGGGLGGFRWGLDLKRWLLDHERTAAPAAA